MASTFKRKEGVRRGARQIAECLVKDAVKVLSRCGSLEAAHQGRKLIKQCRALLLLISDAVRQPEYARCRRRLRKAAVCLAAARDAQVKIQSLDGLVKRQECTRELARRLRSIRQLMVDDCKAQRAALTLGDLPRKAVRQMKRFRSNFHSLKLQEADWRTLRRGLKRAYSSGRDGFRTALRTGKAEHFHEWRKAVKTLFYQLGMLGGSRTGESESLRAELDQLGERLGEHHDLFLLADPASVKRFHEADPAGARLLAKLIRVRELELRAEALRVGRKCYSGRTSRFCDRVEDW